jgi:hypothetical protein
LEVTTDNDAGMSHHAELVHGSGVAAKELAAIADCVPQKSSSFWVFALFMPPLFPVDIRGANLCSAIIAYAV